MLDIIDEYTRECLTTEVARWLRSTDVLEKLGELFVRLGIPAYIRSDNGSEFIAVKLREWLQSWASSRCPSSQAVHGNHLNIKRYVLRDSNSESRR